MMQSAGLVAPSSDRRRAIIGLVLIAAYLGVVVIDLCLWAAVGFYIPTIDNIHPTFDEWLPVRVTTVVFAFGLIAGIVGFCLCLPKRGSHSGRAISVVGMSLSVLVFVAAIYPATLGLLAISVIGFW